MLFVLNTGRAGSRSIANVLSQHPELVCTHEPLPRLVEETAEYRYGRLPAADLSAILAETRPPSIDGRRYAESANRLSLAIPVLASTFPDAQFIWLMRDGREVVSSGMQRGWFDPTVVKDTQWERHRLRGDELGEVDPEEWARWSPFRRVCWLWRRTNELIGSDLAARLADHRPLTTVYVAGTFGVFLTCWYLVAQLANGLRVREQRLQDDYDRLVRLGEQKVRATLRATHELKAPLAAIKSYVYTMRDGYTGELPPATRAVVLRIG